jgi:3-oxoacyl-(acyl-carrier-protein) synthase
VQADDIGVASFHGTSTLLNDRNESEVVSKQMEHLGRTKGNPCLVICQKYLTGHPKGPAAAWMLNGLLQAMTDSIVPGNRNLDNTAGELQRFSHLLYPNKAVKKELKAGLMKSFGFGQAGAEILVVHPDYLLAAAGQWPLCPQCNAWSGVLLACAPSSYMPGMPPPPPSSSLVYA